MLDKISKASQIWGIIFWLCETDRKLSVTARSAQWCIRLCVPWRYWKENTIKWHCSVSHSASPLWSGEFRFFFKKKKRKRKNYCNLDRHTPLANHGSSCRGWYVSVNIVCNSHNSSQSPYQAVMRHSLTLLHFIIDRLAVVLCSDSTSCCQCSDYDGSSDEITGKS